MTALGNQRRRLCQWNNSARRIGSPRRGAVMSRAVEWFNDLADGFGYGAIMALLFLALLMPCDALRAVEAAAMMIGGM
jgi:hypothetical protein